MRSSARRSALLVASLALLRPSLPQTAADSGGAAGLVEKEFSAAIKSLTPASVYCVGKGGIADGSSGVIVSKSGYVLTDGDVGTIIKPAMGADGQVVGRRELSEEIEVRIPDLKRGTYAVYAAKVVKRVAGIDSCLLKIQKPPTSGFPFVTPGTSADLFVGRFTFAMGTSFGQGDGARAGLTAGIVSSLVLAPEGQSGGRIQEIHTSAAINPGVNGGPLVDADGTLVGIISTWGQAEPTNPFQFLGKAYPIDRIRAAYRDLPDFATVFPDPKTLPAKGKNAALLERAILLAVRAAAPAVVSLEIARSEPLRMLVPQPGPRGDAELRRYAGPISAVSVSSDGVLVSSLYNFASTVPLVHLERPNEIEATLGKITSIVAHYPDGTSVPARILAHDQRLGIVCLKADRPAGSPAPVLEGVSDTDGLRVGRILVHVGNPFGATPRGDLLTTVGILSRVHPPDAEPAWRGDVQTDAGLTDANCGGALIDIHGRLVAISTMWNPAQQGRESGIGFGVPWALVERELPSLVAGRSVVLDGYVGVRWTPEAGVVKIVSVEAKGPAETAGVKAGDVLVAIDGKPVTSYTEAFLSVRRRTAGERVAFTVLRDGAKVELAIVVGKRPAS